jgi:hypothetical protein
MYVHTLLNYNVAAVDFVFILHEALFSNGCCVQFLASVAYYGALRNLCRVTLLAVCLHGLCCALNIGIWQCLYHVGLDLDEVYCFGWMRLDL